MEGPKEPSNGNIVLQPLVKELLSAYAKGMSICCAFLHAEASQLLSPWQLRCLSMLWGQSDIVQIHLGGQQSGIVLNTP